MGSSLSNSGVNEDKFREISKILADLVKTIKIVSVYPDNNPLPVKIRESFTERFVDLIAETGGLAFDFDSDEVKYAGQTVYRDQSREDSLAGLFHSSGIVRISFSTSFGYDETDLLLRYLKAFINKEMGAEDLVALLWQADITGFDYDTIEDIALRNYRGDSLIENEDESHSGQPGEPDNDKVQISSVFLDDEEPSGENEPDLPAAPGGHLAEERMGHEPVPGRWEMDLDNIADLLSDAYEVEPPELNQAEKILVADEPFDMYEVTVDLLFEIIRQEDELHEFSEAVTCFEKIHTEILRAGDLKAAGKMVAFLHELEKQLKDKSEPWRQRIRDAIIFTGGYEKISILAESLNANPESPVDALTAYLSHFGWEALSSIVDLLGDLEDRSHRMALCDYLVRVGGDNIPIIARGISDKRWFVVRNTAMILSRIGGLKANAYLKRAIDHDDPRVRLEVARGLGDGISKENAELLVNLVWDTDNRVHRTALETVIGLKSDTGLWSITRIIKDERFAGLKEIDQENLIMHLSLLGGERAVDYLHSLISNVSLFRKEGRTFYQGIAFKALVVNRSARAEAILKKLSRSWRKGIRNMAAEALRKRHEVAEGQ